MKKKSTKIILFLLATLGMIASNYIMGSSPIGQTLLTSFGDGTGMLDFKFYYSTNEAYQALTSLGAAGQSIYTKLLLIDFIFIICTAYFFSRIFLFAVDKLKMQEKYKKMAWFAYARSLFDAVENSAILITIFALPLGKWLLFIASIATVLKWLAMALYVLGFIFVFAVAFIQKLRRKT